MIADDTNMPKCVAGGEFGDSMPSTVASIGRPSFTDDCTGKSSCIRSSGRWPL